MQQPNVALIGFVTSSGPNFRQIKLLSRENLNPFSYVFWDFSSLEGEVTKLLHGEGGFHSVWNQKMLDFFRSKFDERLSELMNLVRAGLNLIVILNSIPFKLKGQGAAVVYDAAKSPIFEDAVFSAIEGEEIEYIGFPEGAESASQLTKNLRYHVAMSGKSLKALFGAPSLIAEHQRVVAGYIQSPESKGCIAFFPRTKDWAIESQKALASRNEFVQRVIGILRSRPKSNAKIAEPAWAAGYRLKSEHAVREQLSVTEGEIARLESQKAELATKLDSMAWTKRLIFADGDALVDAVIRALQRLQVSAVAGPQGLADVVAHFGNTLLSIEVKGVEGAAKSWFGNQCDKWTAGLRAALTTPEDQRDKDDAAYAEILAGLGVKLPIAPDAPEAIQVKGIVVANTFRLLPPIERPTESFSPQLVKAIEGKNLAAITTMQLLTVLAADEANPGVGRTTIENLARSVGCSEDYSDWTTWLTCVAG